MMKITKKEMHVMDETACSIKGVMDSLLTQIKILDADIKAMEKSKMEYDRTLGMLHAKKNDLKARIDKNRAWVDTYDVAVGPFANRYKEMTADIGTLYENAKVGHQKGIELLKKEFDYHPEFFHPSDTFRATPFRPK